MSHYRDSIDNYEIFDLGQFEFQSGSVLPNAKLAYKTLGKLNEDKSNAILLAHPVGGTHENAERIHLEGESRAISTDNHFIIAPNMFGNGLSSSPSNTSSPFDGPNFPSVTIYDNVIAQHKLVTEELGISRIKLVTGFSMGGLQTFHWAAMFPDMVENFVPICGTAKCSGHNWLFLESLAVAISVDPVFDNGNYTQYPYAGMNAFNTIYSGWAFSQEFFRQNGHEKFGLDSYKEMPDAFDERLGPKEPNDILIHIRAWQSADISNSPLYNGDFKAALRSITAKGFIMPTSTDQYFWADDNRDEASLIPNAAFREIPSIWGHVGGSLSQPEERKIVDDAIRELIG
jgi:homoserine O-acetyltransferase